MTGRLVKRPEDNEVNVQREIRYYREAMLRCVEDYIIQHSQQHVVELDANLSPRELFRVRLYYCTCTLCTFNCRVKFRSIIIVIIHTLYELVCRLY